MTNTLTARGISRELGGFVYGFPFYSAIKKQWLMVEETMVKGVDGKERLGLFPVILEGEPQKCLGIRDCEGELIFEGDDVKYPVNYGRQVGGTDLIEYIEDKVSYRNGAFYPTFRHLKDCKIIHPTNKGK